MRRLNEFGIQVVLAACALPVAAAVLPACSSPPDDGVAPADITIVGEGSSRGVFLLAVGPLAGTASFQFSGPADLPSSGFRSIVGNFQLGPSGLTRTTTGDSVEYHPIDPWLWIYDNRGGVGVFGDTALRSYQIRDLSYRADLDRRITVHLVAISTDRIDYATRSILPGEDLIVEVTGHWTPSCTFVDEMGRVFDDPTMAVNPLCRELLSPPAP